MPSVAIIGTRGYPSYYGGFETAVRRLAPFLVEAGWDVTVYSRPGATRDDDPNLDSRVTSVVTWGIEKKSVSTLTYGLTAARHAAKAKPDVALVMNVANGYWLPILKNAGIPTIVNVDGIEWDRAKWGVLARWAFRTGARLTAKHATELIVDARAIGRRWESEFGRNGVFLPYGGDEQAPMPTPLDLPYRGYVLVVARFVPENSIGEFFDAVPAIASSAPVVIVGSSGYGGDLDERAAQLASTHSNVHWLGHISDDDLLAALWQNCGVYFHGHSVGGTNPALVQAMASGAPIVARRTVYNTEVLDDPSQTVDHTAAAIIEGVESMLSDSNKQERASYRNQQRARQEYSWNSICSGYERALAVLAVGEHVGSRVGASRS